MSFLREKIKKMKNDFANEKFGEDSISSLGYHTMFHKREKAKKLSEGEVEVLHKDPIYVQKFHNHFLKGKEKLRTFFKKKNFYCRAIDKKTAVVMAISACSSDITLKLPKRLKGHRIVGAEDPFVMGYTNKYMNVTDFARLTDYGVRPVPKAKKERRLFSPTAFASIQYPEGAEAIVLKDNGQEVTVAAEVRALCFAYLPNATVLRLPSTLLYVGQIFAENLERIEVYESGMSDEYAFRFPPVKFDTFEHDSLHLCEKLTYASLPCGFGTLPKALFYSCRQLRTLHLPDGISSIDITTLDSIKALDELTIGKGLTSCKVNQHLQIGRLCGDAQSLSVFLSALFFRSGEEAFGEDNYLDNVRELTLTGEETVLPVITAPTVEKLTLPEDITEISPEALVNMTLLKKIKIPKTVRVIGKGAFRRMGLSSVALPEGLTVLEDSVFAGCTALSSVTLPSSLKTMHASAFAGCDTLKEIFLPDGLTQIVLEDKYKAAPDTFEKTDEARPPMLTVRFRYNPGTSAEQAVLAFCKDCEVGIAKTTEMIENALSDVDLSDQTLDKYLTATLYLIKTPHKNAVLQSKLIKELADFLTQKEKKATEGAFHYSDYCYALIDALTERGKEEDRASMAPLKARLLARLGAAMKQVRKAETLLAEGTGTEKALPYMVKAYNLYPRCVPALYGLLRAFLDQNYDPKHFESAAMHFYQRMLLCKQNSEIYEKYLSLSNELFAMLNHASYKGRYDSGKSGMSVDARMDLYFKSFNESVSLSYIGKPAPIFSAPTTSTARKPKRLTNGIDKELFARMRQAFEVISLDDMPGRTVEEKKKSRKILCAKAYLLEKAAFPETKIPTDYDIEKIRDSYDVSDLFGAAKEKPKPIVIPSPQSTSSSYTDSTSYSSYGADSSDTPLFTWVGGKRFLHDSYSYSYNNPFSYDTDPDLWAQAEAIGIEWDIIDRDYYLDLGIFGDGSL